MLSKSRFFLWIILTHLIRWNDATYENCQGTDFDLLSGIGESYRDDLTFFDLSNEPIDGFKTPVDMIAFTIPPDAAHPSHAFCGTLTLSDTESRGFATIILDLRNTPAEALHLPSFSQSFVQHGSHLVPTFRGRQEVSSEYWDLIVSPGRVWDEKSDIDSLGQWSRASFPFSLVYKKNNPQVFNGVMMFTFSHFNQTLISKVAYEIAQETSITMRFDLWGLVNATYEKNFFPNSTNTTGIQMEYEQELHGRVPLKHLSELEGDYGLNTLEFGQEIQISFVAFDIDGVTYVDGFSTRRGKFPYPESMIVSSHSIAKTFFAAITALAIEEEFGNVLSTRITDFIDMASGSWDEVTLEDTLDMATGHFLSKTFFVDDNFYNCKFFDSLNFEWQLDKALNCYDKKCEPGTAAVYHSSNTFIASVVLRTFLERFGEYDNIIEYYNTRIVRPLGLSKMIQNALLTSHDVSKQPIGYTGLFFNIDDIVKFARFVNPGNENRGKINGIQVLDPIYLDEALQKNDENDSLPLRAEGENYRYKLGFWSTDYDHFQDCPSFNRIPLAKGFGGSIVAMFPNNSTYISFTSSLQNDWVHNIHGIAKETLQIRCFDNIELI